MYTVRLELSVAVADCVSVERDRAQRAPRTTRRPPDQLRLSGLFSARGVFFGHGLDCGRVQAQTGLAGSFGEWMKIVSREEPSLAFPYRTFELPARNGRDSRVVVSRSVQKCGARALACHTEV